MSAQDVQRWTVRLLALYSDAYARNQFRALQQFFRWLAAEDGIPDPMAWLRPPKETCKPVPCFTSMELSKLAKACRGSAFDERRDAAIIAVFLATGIRLAEMAGIRYHSEDPYSSDIDLAAREVTVRGKGGKSRTVKLSHEAARRLDPYVRARSKHELAWRPELWLGEGIRGPLDRSGIYQLVVRRGQECGVLLYPHRFRHHFCQAWQMGRIASDATFPEKRDHDADVAPEGSFWMRESQQHSRRYKLAAAPLVRGLPRRPAVAAAGATRSAAVPGSSPGVSG